jgi:hypothetical protein
MIFPAVGRLGRLSAFMCVAVAIVGVFAELALAWVWLSPDYVASMVVPRLGLANAPALIDGWTRFLGFLVSMVPMGVLLFMLHQSFKLFDAYRRGDVFTDDAPKRLRRIGLSMVALAPLCPLAAAALGMLMTSANPPGQRILAIGIGLDDMLIGILGGMVLAIGHVMVEAKRLADENRQIV